MKTWFKLTGVLLVLSFTILSSRVFAQASSTVSSTGSFSLQGMLTNTSGTPIADGSHSIMVSVYAQGSSTPIYTETDATTTVGGIFNLMVGANGSSKLMLSSGTNYTVGISVDSQAQLQPQLQLGSAPSAITANVADSAATALNAKTVAGFNVSANGGANTIPVLNAQGQLSASMLGSNLVTSVNGQTGNVILSGGGNLNVGMSGDTVLLSFNGSGGSFTLPFSQALNLSSGTGFNLTNNLGGTVASFANTGTGSALQLSATGGNALSATGASATPAINVLNSGGVALNATSGATSSAALQLKNTSTSGAVQLLQAVNGNGATVANLSNTGLLLNGSATGSGSAVLTLQNAASSTPGNLITAVNANDSSIFTLGTNGSAMLNSTASNAALTVNSTGNAAINATGSVSSGSGAVLKLQNMASDTAGVLISASNSAGNAVLSVADNGATKISSTANTALSVTNNASSGAALMATDSASGGTAARLTGGFSLIGPVGTATLTAGNLTQTISNTYAKANSVIILTVNSAVSGLTSGLRITGQGNGSFTVGLLALTALTSDLSFNYLIINQ